MSHHDDPRPPLSEWIIDAYDVLCSQLETADLAESHGQYSGIPREQAVELLQKTDGLAVEQSDAEYALERLLERGYLYEIDEELRVTFPRE